MAEGLLNNPGAVEENNPSTIGQTAQDISKAQGVSYEALANETQNTATPAYENYNSSKVATDINQNAGLKTATSYIDQAKNTVAGQLNSLLSSDSPYIKQAENKAKEQSASRGLLNSSIAAGAGRAAAYEAALPIAQQDAETYNKYGLQQQATENEQQKIQTEAIVSGEMTKQKAAIELRNQSFQNAFNAKLTGANEQSKAFLQEFAQQHEKGMSDLQYQQNLAIQKFDVNAKKAESVRAATSQIMQNYQVTVENLMTDPDFLDMGADAMNNAINQMQTLARNSMMLVGASAGPEMEAEMLKYVDAYLTDLHVATNPPPATT